MTPQTMALRLLEIQIPLPEQERVAALLSGVPVVPLSTTLTDTETGLVRILLDSAHCEAATDTLARHFGGRADFRLVLLPVEATLPLIADPPSEPVPPEPERSIGVGSQRISREELREDVVHAARLTPVYLVMVVLSTIVAAVGLIRGDIAIIIGAMVIAPLLGPNMALALAATLGDSELAERSLRTIGAGVATAFGLSAALGAIFGADLESAQIAARTQADLADVVLALAAGAAGSLAFTTGVPAVVVGVMVAVALLPPLVVMGLLLGAGLLSPATGAFMLVLTNVTCVNLAAIATFLVQRVRPRLWWEAERASRASRFAVVSWILMLLILTALILLGQVEPSVPAGPGDVPLPAASR